MHFGASALFKNLEATMVFRRCAFSLAKELNLVGPLTGAAGISVALLLGAAPAAGQNSGQFFANPPTLQERGARRPSLALTAPGAPTAPTGRRDFDLTVDYTKYEIWNPATQRPDTVRLRSYIGEGVDPKAPYVAPVIEVRPGQTVTMTLHNKLEADPSCTAHGGDVNKPHCFNGTNLHSHGLWVSPSGNSDNVLLSINPGVDFEYIFNLPPDHPAGTFWYHPHRHGSTALQVSSGMVGALIVRGDRMPTPTTTGDIDVILKNADLTAMEDRILVLQQIQYACLDAQGQVKVQTVSTPNGPKIVAWVCDENDTGIIEKYDYPNNAGLPRTVGFGPGNWVESGRFTTINGRVRPTFEARAGRPERWRLIHGGVRDTITFGFRKRKPNAPVVTALAARDGARFVEENCTGELLPYQQIAADGLTMGKANAVPTSTLQPGYRYDALVVFPEAGDYCVVNESAPAGGSVSREPTSRQLLGMVEVAPGTVPVTNTTVLLQELLSAVALKVLLPPEAGTKVAGELRDGLKFTSFIPHPDIAPGEVTGKQELVFFIHIPPPNPPPGDKTRFEVGNKAIDPLNFNPNDPNQFNPQPYDPNRIDRALKLGGVDEWTLQSGFVGHPFHIHVNPFQIVSITDPSGKDVSLPGAVDNAGGTVDPQYPGLSGVWKDTLWIKDLLSAPADFPDKLATSMYTIKVRTRYQRYIGEFVLHCHILDHEDQGMMQNVQIQIQDGAGGTAAPRH
jgi:FtsP/CotA-like multicopper oxidase with cupredoxin domain